MRRKVKIMRVKVKSNCLKLGDEKYSDEKSKL